MLERLRREAEARGRSPSIILRELALLWTMLSEISNPDQKPFSAQEALLTLGLKIKEARSQGKGWEQISREVEHKFGVKLGKDQMKALSQGWEPLDKSSKAL